jgi:hypothetical protein
MRIGIQAGGGLLIGEPYLTELRGWGFRMLRIQAHTNDRPHFPLTPPDLTSALVEEVLNNGQEPLVMIRDARQIDDIPDRSDVWIEAANEPDLAQFGWTKATYRALVMQCIERTQGRSNPLCIGSISNLDDDSLDWLRSALPWNEIPASVIECYHRYPYSSRGPELGHHKSITGKRWTRERELNELQSIVGSTRPLAVSEVGYHELEFPEDRACDHFAWERAFLERTGHLFACAYQMVDGPQASDHYEAHFGFRDLETGRWKRQTESWTGVKLT